MVTDFIVKAVIINLHVTIKTGGCRKYATYILRVINCSKEINLRVEYLTAVAHSQPRQLSMYRDID